MDQEQAKSLLKDVIQIKSVNPPVEIPTAKAASPSPTVQRVGFLHDFSFAVHFCFEQPASSGASHCPALFRSAYLYMYRNRRRRCYHDTNLASFLF
ncbi:Uncharacterised protein [Bacillus freudenreichii]|nr:Uncharacterised protein [Bacillus freudenreichii]